VAPLPRVKAYATTTSAQAVSPDQCKSADQPPGLLLQQCGFRLDLLERFADLAELGTHPRVDDLGDARLGGVAIVDPQRVGAAGEGQHPQVVAVGGVDAPLPVRGEVVEPDAGLADRSPPGPAPRRRRAISLSSVRRAGPTSRWSTPRTATWP
jgi:hypothetical protein